LAGREELSITFRLNDLEIWVYLGPKPKLGITVSQSGKYIVPGEASLMVVSEYKKDATESSYPRHFFTEIICINQVEVPDDVSESFQAKEPRAHDKLLALAEQRAVPLRAATDLIAGTIGLRFHRQFVIEVINENFFALRSDTDYAYNYASSSVELLEDIRLNSNGIEMMPALLEAVGKAAPEAIEFGASAMAWLLRSWVERDHVSKFMSLFIPIEIILRGYGESSDNVEEKQHTTASIQNLLVKHGGDERSNLIAFFNQAIAHQRPSLASRFEIMAKQAQIDGWQADIAAFRRFNSIRNKLLHRGDRQVRLSISVGEEFEQETRELEDLAERYVSWRLFRDASVYKSQWRPPRTKKQEA